MSESTNFNFIGCSYQVLVQDGLLNVSSPIQTVSGGSDWSIDDDECATYTLSGRCNNSAAIKTDGTLWLWGYGHVLGITDFNINQSSPVQTVTTGTNWKQVSLRDYLSAAVKTDGTLWLWGHNNVGQVGNNSTINVSSPVQTIIGGQSWKDACGPMAIYEVYDW